jgi:hypothetical protein
LSSSLQRLLAASIVIAACALLAAAFLLGATPDEEEFRYTVLTSWLHVRALAGGNYAFWTSLLGFGLPQPLIANYWLHPLLPLLAFTSPIAWMQIVLLVHTIAGALGMWRLSRALEIRPIVSSVCVATFLLATPSQNYVLTDFWPSPWIALTTMPWVLLGVWRVIEGPPRHLLMWSVLLGLGSGLVVANGNPGTLLIYGVFVPALVIARRPALLRRWQYVAAAAIIALAIAAPNLALLGSEQARFTSDLMRGSGGNALPPSAAWDIFLRPFSSSGAPWPDELVHRGARTLFFGGPFAVLCLFACVRLGWQRPDLVLALAIAAFLMFTALVPSPHVSERYLFRDPIVLCAIPLAGMAAERALRQAWSRLPAAALLAAQLVIVVLAFVPFLSEALNERRDGATAHRGAVADQPIADAIVAGMSQPGRLLYSPQVDYEVRERALLASGLGVNALAYRGVPVVNGWFKGVSADAVWPDERRYYSRISTPQPLIESGATLDVLGIRYVLAATGERVAPDLRLHSRLPSGPVSLSLYENTDAWPGAFLLDEDAAGLELPLLAGCENDRLLCRDFSSVAVRGQPDRVDLVRDEGTIDVSIAGRDTPTVLIVTEMFRPAWRASSGGVELATSSFGGGLLAVHVPAGVSSVNLVYRPWPLIGATFLAWFAVITCLAILGAAAVGVYHQRRLTGRISRPHPADARARSWGLRPRIET